MSAPLLIPEQLHAMPTNSNPDSRRIPKLENVMVPFKIDINLVMPGAQPVPPKLNLPFKINHVTPVPIVHTPVHNGDYDVKLRDGSIVVLTWVDTEFHVRNCKPKLVMTADHVAWRGVVQP